jgi:hypothetical protein
MPDVEAWEFTMNEKRDWEWRTVETHSRQELRRSANAFATLAQCVADAALHGYERRFDQRRAGEDERRRKG